MKGKALNPLERLADYAEPVTRHPYILRVRRNHGLEHATIHILNGQNYKLSGRSSGGGFVLCWAMRRPKKSRARWSKP